MTILQAIHVLELELPIADDSVKKAYRQQAKVWHPDNFRIYTQQIDAGRRFIEIKQAYDMLQGLTAKEITLYIQDSTTITRNRAAEAPAYNNHLPLFDTPLYKEAENIFSLFYLFAKWKWFGLPTHLAAIYSRVDNYIKPHKTGIGPQVARLLLFIAIAGGTTLLAAICVPIIAFASLLFVPLMWIYIKSVKALTLLAKVLLGYLPAPNCGRLTGELSYLIMRTLMPVILLVGGLNYMPFTSLRIVYWLLLSGYILFTVLINISVLYEWISFFRVQYLRTQIKNPNS